ncbi:hypothetical protein PanWU01x14_189640 [Parasponia andersonii]|uniref:Uncharacterized protein n=1 Tax=Parasponia andersonii TaxID=3476 RepID=A0A2P5C2N3_PARAD|nr:hypothetical protein PanWU01x14_189640 [Parasponia andersonii]
MEGKKKITKQEQDTGHCLQSSLPLKCQRGTRFETIEPSKLNNNTLRCYCIFFYHLAIAGAQVESSLFDQPSLIPQAWIGLSLSICSPEASFSNCEQYFRNVSTLT